MGRQYGTPPTPEGMRGQQEKFGRQRKDPEPQVKEEDPTPPTETVELFHQNAQVDTRPEDIHHRLGGGENQAAAGNHKHNGTDSPLLGAGVTLTGAKGGNAAVNSLVAAMVQMFGVTDNTT